MTSAAITGWIRRLVGNGAGLRAAFVLSTCLSPLYGDPVFASENNGWLAGISYGSSQLDMHDLQADHTDDSGTYVKLIGESVLNKHFSIEYGYLDYGSFSAHYINDNENVTVDGFALTVSALAGMKITPRLRLTGKIGLDYWSQDVSVDFTFSNRPQHAAGHGSGISSLFGVGLEYALAKEIRIRLEVEKYRGIDLEVDLSTNGLDPIDLSKNDVDIIGAMFLYEF